jgi:peptidoglycan/xylan/chitin deacetylase (PgdA/CDA1 family)
VIQKSEALADLNGFVTFIKWQQKKECIMHLTNFRPWTSLNLLAHNVMRYIALLLCGVCMALISYSSNKAFAAATQKEAMPTNAVILLYHHVSTQTPASTSISPSKFKEHMAYLKENHVVVSLQEVVDALTNKTPLPDKAVAITFDDGYANILENAHPVLTELGFPYTIFINPGEIGVGSKQLTWEQVESMHNEGVSFANHTMDHLHMLNDMQSMGQKAWLENVWQNVEEAQKQLDSRLATGTQYLAYPFGEYNQTLEQQLKTHGYIGFGQHSGAVGPYSSMQALPRFPAAGPYANLSSLKTKLNSLAMPVKSSSITDPQLKTRSLANPVRLTIESEDMRASQVTCFFGGDPIETRVEDNTVSFTLDTSLPIGRSRVNCTAPSIQQPGRYYWYSQPFFVADSNGNYPD